MHRIRISEEVKALRAERSWSQDLLAQNAGVSKRTIQRLEKDGHCSHETLLAVAGAFDIDVRQLTRLVQTPSVIVQDQPTTMNQSLEFSMPGTLQRWASMFPVINKRFYKNIATTGLALLIIPVLFIVVNVLKYSMGVSGLLNPFDMLKSIPLLYQILTSPVFLISSLVIALGLNVLPLINFNVTKEPNQLTGAFSIKGNKWNAMVAGASLFLMTFMMGYVAVENISETPVAGVDQVVEDATPVAQADISLAEQELKLAAELAELAEREDQLNQARMAADIAAELELINQAKLEAQSRQGTAELIRSFQNLLYAHAQSTMDAAVQLKRERIIFDDIISNKTSQLTYNRNLAGLESLITNHSNLDMAILETLNFYEAFIIGDYQGELVINGEEYVITSENGVSTQVKKLDAVEYTYEKLTHQLAESVIQQRELIEWMKLGDITAIEPEYIENKLKPLQEIRESNLDLLREMYTLLFNTSSK